MLSFETIPDAKLRTADQAAKVSSGKIKPHDHVGNFDALKWDKEALEIEVSDVQFNPSNNLLHNQSQSLVNTV